MNLANNIQFVFSPFTDQDYLPEYFIIQAGICGVLPRIKISFTNYSDSIESDEFNLELVIDGVSIVKTPGFIYKRSYKGDLNVTYDCYLVPKDLVYGIGMKTYESYSDIISDLWKSSIQNMTSNSTQSIFNTVLNPNHEYLTKVCMGLDSKLCFAYNLKNELFFWDWSKVESKSPFQLKGSPFEYLTDEFDLSYNPKFDSELIESQINDYNDSWRLTQHLFYDNIRYFDESMGVNSVYNNYVSNRWKYLQLNEPIRIRYLGAGLEELCKVYPIGLTDEIQDNYRAYYQQINYSHNKIETIVELRKMTV